MGNKKVKKIADSMWKYDSDEDLSEKERRKIKESQRPDKTREDIWEEKGTWDKTKKLIKSGWYGDKRNRYKKK